jgi:hypothetical protein
VQGFYLWLVVPLAVVWLVLLWLWVVWYRRKVKRSRPLCSYYAQKTEGHPLPALTLVEHDCLASATASKERRHG